MKELIRHFLLNNPDEVIEKSLFNCHVIGLHSIMLLDSPGKTIRLYIADKNHELWMNKMALVSDGGLMSLGFHPHHCQLTLKVLRGYLTNWIVRETHKEYCDFKHKKYLYHSKISEGEMEFEEIQDSYLRSVSYKTLIEGYSFEMEANEIHTVSCPKDSLVAWLVFEGREDENYKPYCYSNVDLNKADSSFLYQKPSYAMICEMLRKADLI